MLELRAKQQQVIESSCRLLDNSSVVSNWHKVSSALICALFLTSCISPNISDWPDSIPPVEIFINAYAVDLQNQSRQSQTEYLQWALSFYQGNLAYQSGWEDIHGYVYEAPTSAMGELLTGQLTLLGVAIGGEWAKGNDTRLIDTRMLSLWGSTIQLAPNFEKQRQTVELISDDVAQLLIGNLHKEDIVERRYTKLLGLELFGDF